MEQSRRLNEEAESIDRQWGRELGGVRVWIRGDVHDMLRKRSVSMHCLRASHHHRRQCWSIEKGNVTDRASAEVQLQRCVAPVCGDAQPLPSTRVSLPLLCSLLFPSPPSPCRCCLSTTPLLLLSLCARGRDGAQTPNGQAETKTKESVKDRTVHLALVRRREGKGKEKGTRVWTLHCAALRRDRTASTHEHSG